MDPPLEEGVQDEPGAPLGGALHSETPTAVAQQESEHPEGMRSGKERRATTMVGGEEGSVWTPHSKRGSRRTPEHR